MSKNQKKLYTGISFAILFAVFIVFLLTWRLNRQVVTPIPTIEITANTKTAVPSPTIKFSAKTQKSNLVSSPAIEPTVEISDSINTEKITLILGNETIDLSFAPNTLFYDALVDSKNQGKILFDGKNYPGLGFFVTDIGTLHSGGGKNLLYYINGKEATVGVSSYTLKDGDIILWKLE